jgi:hypothetical protein
MHIYTIHTYIYIYMYFIIVPNINFWHVVSSKRERERKIAYIDFIRTTILCRSNNKY